MVLRADGQPIFGPPAGWEESAIRRCSPPPQLSRATKIDHIYINGYVSLVNRNLSLKRADGAKVAAWVFRVRKERMTSSPDPHHRLQ
jgi:hypothetical protein